MSAQEKQKLLDALRAQPTRVAVKPQSRFFVKAARLAAQDGGVDILPRNVLLVNAVQLQRIIDADIPFQLASP